MYTNNFTTYITIENNSSIELTNVKTGTSHGSYQEDPKEKLPQNSYTQYQLLSGFGAVGSAGWTKYDAGSGVIEFKYACPFGLFSKNLISVTTGKSGLVVWYQGVSDYADYIMGVSKSENGTYSTSGHPFSIAFLIKDPT